MKRSQRRFSLACGLAIALFSSSASAFAMQSGGAIKPPKLGGSGGKNSGKDGSAKPADQAKNGGGKPSSDATQPTASENDTATAIRGLTASGNANGSSYSDPWWAAHGGVLHLGAPDRPAVLLVHGLHQSAQDFTHPSITGVNYDVDHAPADRDLGASDTAGVGIESVGVSSLASVDGDDWFDFLAHENCTVGAWTMPTYDVFEALNSASDALAHLQQATRAVDASSPPPIALVGHSLGGLVIRALLKEKGNLGGQIQWVITLCSPHQGSELALAPQKLEDDAAAWAGQVPLPGVLSDPIQDVARQMTAALIDMFAPPIDPASKQLAPNSAMLQALAAGETALPGVRYDTFGGTNPNYVRVYAWTFDAESAVPQFAGASVYFKWKVHANEIAPASPMLAKLPHFFPEITQGQGDGLVADARAHLPWSIRHTLPLNHAQVLWNRALQHEVASILIGEKQKGALGDLVRGPGAIADSARGVIDAANGAIAKAKGALDELFAIELDPALKGRLGRLVIDFPSGADFGETQIELCEPASGGQTSKKLASGYGAQSFELLPGTYDLSIEHAAVAGVRVEARSATRVKVGGLHVAASSSTRVELFDADGKQQLVSFYGEHVIGLPAGNFALRIAGKIEPIQIKAGAITEF
jgi:pimeloyl-ACP methyl ester carboxylesterase